MCQIYRKHGEKIRAFTSVTDRGGHPTVTVQGSTFGLGDEMGTIIRTLRAAGHFGRSTDNPGMKTDSMPRETAGKKWDRTMKVDCSGYLKAAGPTAPAIKDRNYDKNIHVTSTNDVRSNFGRSNDFTSKAENIGCIKALPMDRRIPPCQDACPDARVPCCRPADIGLDTLDGSRCRPCSIDWAISIPSEEAHGVRDS